MQLSLHLPSGKRGHEQSGHAVRRKAKRRCPTKALSVEASDTDQTWRYSGHSGRRSSMADGANSTQFDYWQ